MKALTEIFTKRDNLFKIFDEFLMSIHFRKESFEFSDNLTLNNGENCLFDNFQLEKDQIYFVNDWDDCDAGTIRRI